MKKEFVLLRTSAIKPYENNPRINDSAVDAVIESINQCEYIDPIEIDENNVILSGHTRLKALQKLKIKSADCIRVTGLTEEQKRKYRLLTNKTGELADWDLEKLGAELDDLDFGDFDFGFDLPEENDEPQEISEDNYEEPAPKQPKSKLGDIYELGNHRLICGDCTDVNVIDRLMDGVKADCVFTDPPYGMKKESEGVLNDNLNYDDLLDFNRQWIPLTFGALKDTGCWYCWGIDEPLMDIYSAILKPLKRQNKIVIRNYITWAKHSAFGIGSSLQLSYPKETEKCWFIMKGQDWNNNNAEFFNTKFERILDYLRGEADKAGIKQKDVERVTGVQMYSHWFTKSQFSIMSEKHYEEFQKAYPECFKKPYAELRTMLGESNNPTAELKPYFDATTNNPVGDIGLTDVWRFPVTSNKEREGLDHATPKPIALCSRAINASSQEGQIVLDVFGGSGSTLIACEQLNRKCYMCELDPKYVDVIIDRWEKFTGKKAVKLK
jgi:DNA modification methylase